MTENERQEILSDIKDGYIDAWDNMAIDKLFETIEKEHNEIQQYRAIGTVEEIQKKMEELDRWHTDKINENIKNPFAYTSTLICHNCDHKDDYIEELEAEVEEYKSIGTIEEFKALKEKATPKKGIPYTSSNNHKFVECPSCHKDMDLYYDFCQYCGQSVDWGKSKT